jgi:acetyl-CoA acetyltransferase
MSMSRKTAICGVGETDWSKDSQRTTVTLATQAIQAALKDAGMAPHDVDGMLCYGETDSTDPCDVASALGIRLNYQGCFFGGGSSAELLVSTAAAAITAGLAETIVCYRSMNGRSGVRMGAHLDQIAIPHMEFMLPYGFMSAAQMFAFMARRHMYEFGTTKEQLGHVALAFREHANRNPKAMMFDRTLDMESYLTARPVSDPFGLFDCCLETDGACCLIVTTAERAQDCRNVPVLVAGAAARVTKENPGNFLVAEDFTEAAGKHVAPRIFAMAGLNPADVDVASLYDCFTFTVITQLEAYGFVKRGEGGPFVEEGNLRLGGALPSNTAGGMLSEAYTHGLNNLIELVRQLRHEYVTTDRQVPNAQVGLCAGWANPGVASGLILERGI